MQRNRIISQLELNMVSLLVEVLALVSQILRISSSKFVDLVVGGSVINGALRLVSIITLIVYEKY